MTLITMSGGFRSWIAPVFALTVLLISARVSPGQSSVTVVGDLQSELGCPGDWQPDCAASHLAYDAGDDVWQGTFSIPAGAWQYKVTIDDSFAESYPASNANLSLASASDVKFYYDHKTNWIVDSIGTAIAVAIGDFQSELGCPGDWQPDCLRSWLQDPDGDGTFTYMTSGIPPGAYEAKVAHNEAFSETYPSSNLPFSVGTAPILFSYNLSTHVLTISSPGSASSVTIVGSLQDELGCPGDWQPDCATTHLVYDVGDDVWHGTFNIPAGAWQYKAAIDDAWDESYPASNANLSLASASDVKFYYDHKTNWIVDSIGTAIAVAIGDFQSELGCVGDWQPWCLRSWLQDPDGDGTFTFMTSGIPPGSYEAKVAHNEAFNETYPASNLPFTVGTNPVLFSYNLSTHILTISSVVLPVELSSFDVLARQDGVVLNWSTSSETNNLGFMVEHQPSGEDFKDIGFVPGNGTSETENRYRIEVGELEPGLHRFRLKQVDFDGNFEYSPVVEASLTVSDRFVISHAYPNPFNPSTTLRFAVANEQHVSVTLINTVGQTVATLHRGMAPANEMQTIVIDAVGLPSGAYLVRFEGSLGMSGVERIVLAK